MTRIEIERTYGPQANDPSPLTRKCRLLQSWYRVKVLEERDHGLHKLNGRPVGSALKENAVGTNFLSDAARACALEKLAEKELINPDLTVDRYRLLNNMLSSQPMCFNLFADLRLAIQHGHANAAEVIKAIFREVAVGAVQRVEVEMLPQPRADYINDKTAWDAAVLFITPNGKPGLISIETKYTDKLGCNRAQNEVLQKQKARELGLFNKDGQDWYATHCFDQVVRNLLLTIAYGHRHGFEIATNYVMAPAEDVESRNLVQHLQERLSDKYRDAIRHLSLEEAVDRGLKVADRYFKKHLGRFHERYLDFGKVEHLVS